MPVNIAMAAAGARAPPRFPEGRRPTVYEAALAAQAVASVGLCLGMFGIADPPRETLLAIAMFAWGVRIGWRGYRGVRRVGKGGIDELRCADGPHGREARGPLQAVGARRQADEAVGA